MKKAYMRRKTAARMAALQAALMLTAAAAAGGLLYLRPYMADLRACCLATLALMGGGGGFYLGGKTSPRWIRAGAAASVSGMALIAALVASLEPRLLTAGTLAAMALPLSISAFIGALAGAGRTESRRLRQKAAGEAGPGPAPAFRNSGPSRSVQARNAAKTLDISRQI